MQPIDWPRILGDLIATGMTQPRIADACGCGQSTVSELLNGRAKNPRTDTGLLLLKLAHAHGVDVADVLAGFTLPAPEAATTGA